MTLDSDNVRFMWIFTGVPWKGGVIQQFFRAFECYVFGTLGNEANIIGSRALSFSDHYFQFCVCLSGCQDVRMSVRMSSVRIFKMFLLREFLSE